jgi:signal transduction histidine kinase/HPt (histidine-containing phosphotransfer) domain-containing protein/ActR/RegA family two-component response regulator
MKQRRPGLQSPYWRFFKEAVSAMAIADKNGILVSSNDSFNTLIKTLSGSSPDISRNTARLGSSLDFLPIHDAVRISNLLSQLTNSDMPWMELKTPYHDKTSSVHWFRIQAWKMNTGPQVDLSDRGPFIGFIMHDETVEKEAEEKLQEDMHIAEMAMEAKSRFLAAMSHEIRTPIQTIIGMTELLEDTSLNGEQSEFAQQIQFSAELLLSLVNDILDYSKIEAGKMELEHTAFSPAETVERVVEMFSPEIAKKGLARIVEISPEGRPPVLGDPGKFRQVVINLVKNAVKFTPRGTITVGLSAAPGADPRNKTLTVSVADTGIGIPVNARERLFTTFMQADSSHTRNYGGTGLGLAISRNLVELMGGTIEMVPNPGGGSVFRFTVPVEGPGIPELPGGAETAGLPPGSVSPQEPPGAEKTLNVLVVEDHPVNRRLFVLILEKIGVKALCAEDGQEGIDRALSYPADLVFMDIQMPRMNGYEAAAELRRRGFSKPLIAVTAGGFSGERKRCLEAGFDDVLLKPFKKTDVEAVYRTWAGAAAGQTGGQEPPFPGQNLPAQPRLKGAPVFNAKELLDTFMHDERSARNLLGYFVKRSAGQLEALPGMIREGNWEEARRIAHTIKGSSMTLSGMELGKAAAVLEKACREGDERKTAQALPFLEEAFERFKRSSEEYLQS